MAEFLYTGKTIIEEMRNEKSNQNIWGKPLLRLALFFSQWNLCKNIYFTT